jgi:very-short-patch-repair endonuclease
MEHRARDLRKHMTDAERLLWRCLRDRQLGGYKFRHQHPIGPFIVDFTCLEKKIVIEIDGSQHINNRKADNKRSDYLKNHGFRVLRVWNNQVLQEKEAVLSMILTSLSSDDPPHPDPLPEGRGRNG